MLNLEKGVVTTSTSWSPDGRYLLATCSKWVLPSKNIVKHYLLDTDPHTIGEINYGINESDTNGILVAKWAPSGNNIHFGVSTSDRTGSGHCFLICSLDGKDLKGVETNYTDPSSIIKILGILVFRGILTGAPILVKWYLNGETPKTTLLKYTL